MNKKYHEKYNTKECNPLKLIYAYSNVTLLDYFSSVCKTEGLINAGAIFWVIAQNRLDILKYI